MPIVTLPRTLVAGTRENVKDIEENFATFAHATGQPTSGVLNGQLDESNLAVSARPRHLLSEWQTVQHATGRVGIFSADGLYVLSGISVSSLSFVTQELPDLVGLPAVSDFPVTGLTTKARIFASWACNSTSPNVSVNLALYRITSVSGGSNVVALGTGGNSPGIGFTPVANSVGLVFGPEFDLPVDGFEWFIGLFLPTDAQGASDVAVTARLEVRHV